MRGSLVLLKFLGHTLLAACTNDNEIGVGCVLRRDKLEGRRWLMRVPSLFHI